MRTKMFGLSQSARTILMSVTAFNVVVLSAVVGSTASAEVLLNEPSDIIIYDESGSTIAWSLVKDANGAEWIQAQVCPANQLIKALSECEKPIAISKVADLKERAIRFLGEWAKKAPGTSLKELAAAEIAAIANLLEGQKKVNEWSAMQAELQKAKDLAEHFPSSDYPRNYEKLKQKSDRLQKAIEPLEHASLVLDSRLQEMVRVIRENSPENQAPYEITGSQMKGTFIFEFLNSIRPLSTTEVTELLTRIADRSICDYSDDSRVVFKNGEVTVLRSEGQNLQNNGSQRMRIIGNKIQREKDNKNFIILNPDRSMSSHWGPVICTLN